MKKTSILYTNTQNVLIPMYLHMKIFNTTETNRSALSTDHNAAYMALAFNLQFSLSHINMTNFQTRLIPSIVFVINPHHLGYT